MGLLRALSSRHHVDFVSVRRPETTDDQIDDVGKILSGKPLLFASRAPARTHRLAAAWRWSIAIVQSEPPWSRAHRHRDVERFLTANVDRYDAVVCLDNAVTINLRCLTSTAPVIVDIHNVVGWSVQALRTLPPAGLSDRLRVLLSVWLTQRSERRSVGRVDGIIVTSDEEAQRLFALYGTTVDASIPSGADLPRRPLRSAGSGTVGWIGGHNYAPNRDGLVAFVHEGWEPLGRAGYRLLIGGANPPAEIAALANVRGVEVLGYVDDLDSFLSRVDIAVVPLWAGAGVKLKTVTFLGSGIPLVSTIVGFEGTGVVDGVHGLVRESPQDIAAAVQGLLTDPDLAQSIGSNGRDLVTRQLTWDSVGAEFADVVELLVGRRY